MSNELNDFNLGHSTAYAYAKASGDLPEGMTPEEYGELLASYATVGQTAVTAAQTATTKASEAATSATTATNKASEATTAATTATNKAAEAQADADAAALDASQAMSAASTATTKATEATTAAATATSAKTDAVAANAAAQSAKTAAQTAQTGAETAAASVQSSAAQIQTNADDISELKEDLTQKYVSKNDVGLCIGLNKFNKDTVITGKEVYSDGTLDTNSKSAASDYIYVRGAFNVYLKNLPTYTSAALAGRYSHFYDADKNPVGSYTAISKTATSALIYVPSNAYYFRFSPYQRADADQLPIDYSNIIVSIEYTDVTYAPYEKEVESINGNKLYVNCVDYAEGLKVIIFGDSITETANINDDGTGYTAGYRQNWPTYASDFMRWGSYKNYAKSGAAYKDRGTGYTYRQKVSDQIALSIADSSNDDADIIVFSLGTNDGGSDLGSYETAMSKATLADLDQTKLYEALRYAYWSVRNKYKNALCFSALPIQRADGEQSANMLEAITKMANRYNFIIINAYGESGIIRENNTWNANGTDLSDGLHPNVNGRIKMAKLYTDVIMKNLIWR